jgi:sensor histidine kinase YesM
MPKQMHARSGGIGLVNVRRRLDLLYPGKYHLDIHDNPQTYIVNLKLSLDS